MREAVSSYIVVRDPHGRLDVDRSVYEIDVFAAALLKVEVF